MVYNYIVFYIHSYKHTYMLFLFWSCLQVGRSMQHARGTWYCNSLCCYSFLIWLVHLLLHSFLRMHVRLMPLIDQKDHLNLLDGFTYTMVREGGICSNSNTFGNVSLGCIPVDSDRWIHKMVTRSFYCLIVLCFPRVRVSHGFCYFYFVFIFNRLLI